VSLIGVKDSGYHLHICMLLDLINLFVMKKSSIKEKLDLIFIIVMFV
jgi:hypothetical protein